MRHPFILFISALLCAWTARAQCCSPDTLDSAPYSFVRHAANNIQLNGDDWTELTAKYAASGAEPFTIVHIGDSHLQADVATGCVRQLLQAGKESAGRGLVIPFKLASTNEPVDYRFTLDCPAQGSRLLKKPWLTDMAFTGIGVAPAANSFTLAIEQLDPEQPPFRFVRVYATGEYQITGCDTHHIVKTSFTVDRDSTEGYTDIFLDVPTQQIDLTFYAPSTVTIHAAMLSAEQPGIFYHVIGNNGATYDTYNELDCFATQVATLYPDLIIVSLGTNDAYARYDNDLFYSHIHTLVSRLQAQNPEARLLLTTPKECQRKTGRRRRKKHFTVVDDCNRLRNVILDYASQNNIPVYDWFEVAGGQGASTFWLGENLLSQDRVHDTRQGYLLAGQLFHSALERALNP